MKLLSRVQEKTNRFLNRRVENKFLIIRSFTTFEIYKYISQ